MSQVDDGTPASPEVTPVVPSALTPDAAHDPYRGLRFRDFRLLLIGSFVAQFGQQMLTIALGWELYDRTRSALVLGGVGLAQVIPIIVLSLPAGHIADRYNRKNIVMLAQFALSVGALGLAFLSYSHGALLAHLWLPRRHGRGPGLQQSRRFRAGRSGYSTAGF